MESIKLMTLFSGYDSQAMAMERLKEDIPGFDYELVRWCEIDEYASTLHDLAFPEWAGRNLGDITKVDWDQVRSEVGDIDVLTYSSPCFVEGTLVMTSEGLKRIEEIKGDDYVLTHKNEYRKVVTPMVRRYNGSMCNIKSMCFDNLDCTPEHPFYVREMYRKGHKHVRAFRDPVWKKAQDLSLKDYLGVAINRKSEFPSWSGVEDNRWGHHRVSNRLSELFTNRSFWYLMGRYVGDGWRRCIPNVTYGIIICCNDSERDKVSLEKAISECGFNYNVVKERTVNKIQITSKELYEFVVRYGYYAHGKKIDGETLNLPVDYLRSFVEGYMASDGSYLESIKLYKASSVSRELIYGVAQCVAKAYRMPYKIYYQKRSDKHVIEGRTVNQAPQWQICWKSEASKFDHAFYEDGYIWCPIRSIGSFDADCDVYNMEVDEDNSYTANGCIVHNCTDFSSAGRMAGGEKGSGTRSSLLWECEKAIETLRPKYLMLENVKNLVGSRFLSLFMDWIGVLDTLGYDSYWKVMNAADYGVPQHRDRVFVISIRKDVSDGGYVFPAKFPLERKLKDLLEPEVDDMYYLSEKSLENFNLKVRGGNG